MGPERGLARQRVAAAASPAMADLNILAEGKEQSLDMAFRSEIENRLVQFVESFSKYEFPIDH